MTYRTSIAQEIFWFPPRVCTLSTPFSSDTARATHAELITAAKALIKALHDFDDSDPGHQIIALQAAIAHAEELAP